MNKQMAFKIPKKKRMIGHGEHADIYETPEGKTLQYSGTEKEHFDNPKYWKED